MKLTIKNKILTATYDSPPCYYIIALIRLIQIRRTSGLQTKIPELQVLRNAIQEIMMKKVILIRE